MIVPLGFVSDHMEVKWDLDTEAMETAGGLGVLAVRVPTPGVDPAYVTGLIDLVLERATACRLPTARPSRRSAPGTTCVVRAAVRMCGSASSPPWLG